MHAEAHLISLVIIQVWGGGRWGAVVPSERASERKKTHTHTHIHTHGA